MVAGLAMVLGVVTAAIAPWNGLVITANQSGQSLSIVEPAKWKTRALPLPIMPHNVQSSADGRYVFVTGMGELAAFDFRHPSRIRQLFSIAVGMHPAHVVANHADRFAYVTVSGEDSVKVIDLRSKAVAATIPVGRTPHGLRMSPDERRIYVCDMGENAISVLDVARRKEIARIRVGKEPVQVAVAPDGATLFVTLAGQNAVAVVDAATRRVLQRIAVGLNPAQLFVSPDGKRVYVANQGTTAAPGHSVSVISTVSRSVIATVNVPYGAHGVVVAPDGSRVYVTSAFASTLSEIDARTYHVRSIRVDQAPNGVTVLPLPPSESRP